MQERSTFAYFRVQHGEQARKSRIIKEAPFMEPSIEGELKGGKLVGQTTYLGERGEIFFDTVIWKAQNGKT